MIIDGYVAEQIVQGQATPQIKPILNTVTIPIENFEDCKPYLEYENGELYEVWQVGDRGSKLVRNVNTEIVKQIKADALKPIAKIIDDFACGKIELSLSALKQISHNIAEQIKEQKNEQT